MKTWKEKIMAATSGSNNRGVALWYSHAAICKRISEAQGWNVNDRYRSLSCYLAALVKSGHLERADMPRQLSRKVQPDGRPEYLYRQTGKLYKRNPAPWSSFKNENTNAAHKAYQAHELWRLYPKLPKWFRKMMMD